MKLRNKKTGEIVDLIGTERSCPYITINIDFHDGNPRAFDYTSLTELIADWEDYTPAEPLIKDEKIRKAVRAWAEAWNKNKLYKDADNVLSTVDNFVIQFGQTAFIDLEEKKSYTIAELCGEEEE